MSLPAHSEVRPVKSDDAYRRIDTLIAVGLRLARAAPSGKILLARIADSIEPEWIPRPWGDEILAAFDDAAARTRRPIEYRRVERLLRRCWGTRPGAVLDSLEREPVAVTPSCQVHRGELEGTPVAIKVARPGLAASVRRDLVTLEGLLAPLAAAFPALDAGALVGEFRERILDELDFEHEATVQRRFHRALRGHPFLTAPAPFMNLSHERVLVSEWIDGVPLWRAPDPDLAAARLVVFVFGAGREGLVHADPHPDDVLVLPDGRLAILDFGASREVDASRLDLAARALEAFVVGDSQTLGEQLQRLGWLPAEQGTTVLELAHDALRELAGPDPVRLDSAALLAVRDRLVDRPGPLAELLLAGALPPEDLWPARAAAQLFATIARVGATAPWRELVRRALRDGWATDAG